VLPRTDGARAGRAAAPARGDPGAVRGAVARACRAGVRPEPPGPFRQSRPARNDLRRRQRRLPVPRPHPSVVPLAGGRGAGHRRHGDPGGRLRRAPTDLRDVHPALPGVRAPPAQAGCVPTAPPGSRAARRPLVRHLPVRLADPAATDPGGWAVAQPVHLEPRRAGDERRVRLAELALRGAAVPRPEAEASPLPNPSPARGRGVGEGAPRRHRQTRCGSISGNSPSTGQP
jgi:hypothetical protein